MIPTINPIHIRLNKIFGRGFVRLWVGDLYDDAYIIALVIMIPALVPLTQNLGITILRVMNMHKYRSYMYIVIAIINVIATIPLAMKFQGIGAAIATCGANILGQILFMNFFYAKIIKLDIKEYWMNFIKLFIYSMPFVFMFYRCEISSWGTFIVWAVVYSIAYLIGYYILMANDYEKNLVKSFVGRIIKR